MEKWNFKDKNGMWTLKLIKNLKVRILKILVAEPMAVDAISFQQGGKPGLPSPVTIRWEHFLDMVGTSEKCFYSTKYF